MSTRRGTAFPRQPLSPRLWVMLFAAGACLAIFFATVAWVFEGANVVTPAAAEFDRSISLALAQFRDNGGPTGRMTEISAAGSPAIVLIFAIVLASVLLKSRDWLGFAHLTTALLSASVLARLLQYLWERPRPETLLSYLTVTDHSFPSAHLFGAAACYVTFAFFYARYSGGRATEIVAHALAALLVVMIGFTRVYLGAHHTTDVIAGIAGGWAYGLLVAVIFSPWYRADHASR
jgi:undecaprenyl-diphosphatase